MSVPRRRLTHIPEVLLDPVLPLDCKPPHFQAWRCRCGLEVISRKAGGSLSGEAGPLSSPGTRDKCSPWQTTWKPLSLEHTKRPRPYRLGPSTQWHVNGSQVSYHMASRKPGDNSVFQLLELWERSSKDPQKKTGNAREGPMNQRTYSQAQSPPNKAQRAIILHAGSKRSEKLGDWLKGTEPPSKRTSNTCRFWSSFHKATVPYWRDSKSLLLNHLVILGFEEFNTRRLPHMAFSFHVKTSSENIPNSSGFTLPQRSCEKNWPSTQPAETSQWLPLQEMYIIKIECGSMNFIHTCPLGLFIRNNYLCLLSQEHIFYEVH